MKHALLPVGLVLLVVTAVACDSPSPSSDATATPPVSAPAATGERPLPGATATPTATASPTNSRATTSTALPSATLTPTPATGPKSTVIPALASFGTFAQQVDTAVQQQDADFFSDLGVEVTITCTGNEGGGPCEGQPANFTITGIPGVAWMSPVCQAEVRHLRKQMIPPGRDRTTKTDDHDDGNRARARR